MRRSALLLTLALAASATPVHADSINVDLTVSFFPPATFPADSHFVGAASFYIDIVGGNGPQATDSPGVIFLDVFSRAVTALEDPALVDPCIGDGSCGVDVSVRGKVGTFLAFAFPNTADFPATPPTQAPILPIGSLALNDPCRHHLGDPCRQSGQIVAYDPGPVVVGTWDITMNEVPEPNGMVLVGSTLLLVGWHRITRQS